MARTPTLALLLLLLVTSPSGVARASDGVWLGRPLASWNVAAGTIPRPAASPESREALVARCALAPRQSTPAERALFAVGWTPLLHFDRQLVRGDIEVVAGVSAATERCEPSALNLFVFVGGQFAGTLSPTTMQAGRDGAIGAVRVLADDTVTAEFARYASTDTDCCPSSRVRVAFRIDRSGRAPVVVPVEAKQVRG